MIIEGEWRETSLAFIDFIKINYNEDPYDYLKCMGYEIPYINNLKCGILYDYFKSYIELFRFLGGIIRMCEQVAASGNTLILYSA